MKKYSKEQIAVIVASFIVLTATAVLVTSINPSIDNISGKSKYSRSIDSVKFLDQNILSFNNNSQKAARDINNFKIKKKVVVKKAPVVVKKVITTEWVAADVQPYPKSELTMVLSINDRVKLKVGGKVGEYGIGDKVPVGILIEKEREINSRTYTGGSRKTEKVFMGRITHILKRVIYVSSYDKKKTFKIKPSQGPVEVSSDVLPRTRKSKTGAGEEGKGKKKRF